MEPSRQILYHSGVLCCFQAGCHAQRPTFFQGTEIKIKIPFNPSVVNYSPVSGSRIIEQTRGISGSRGEVGTGGGVRQYLDRDRVGKSVLGGGSRGLLCH